MIELPKEIKVGGMHYKVLYPYIFKEDSRFIGMCSYYSQEIRIANSFESVERSDSAVLSTFLHEIIHAIDHIYCNYSFSEETVKKLEICLFSIFMYNPDFISNDICPKSVDIIGRQYDVVYPYTFKDVTEKASIINNNSSKIYISGIVENEAIVISSVKCILLYSMLYSSVILDMFEDSNGDSTIDRKVLKSFSNGVYQVFVDNDIESLFRKLRG